MGGAGRCPERAEAIAAVGAVLTARKAELAELVSREAGKVRIEGGGEVQEAIDMAAFVAGQGRSAMGRRRARPRCRRRSRGPPGSRSASSG